MLALTRLVYGACAVAMALLPGSVESCGLCFKGAPLSAVSSRMCLGLQVLLLLCAVLPWTLVVNGSGQVDAQYPGTALERLKGIHMRVKTLSSQDLSVDWQEVRRRLLWAGGLRDLPDVPPGQGCTAHSFNDDTHCDLTAMLGGSPEMLEVSSR